MAIIISAEGSRAFLFASNSPLSMECPRPSARQWQTIDSGLLFQETMLKKCSKCKNWKPVTEFHKSKSKKDGLKSWCKECARIYRITYLEKPEVREAVRNREAEYRHAHRDEILERTRRWMSENIEKVLELHKRYKISDLKKYHKNQVIYTDRYRKKHPEKFRESARRQLRAWRKANPEKPREYSKNRRALKKGGGGKISMKEWASLKEKYNFTCLCCGKREPEIQLTIDHVLPLVMGGTHTIDNIQPLCLSCNSRKQAKCIDYRGLR